MPIKKALKNLIHDSKPYNWTLLISLAGKLRSEQIYVYSWNFGHLATLSSVPSAVHAFLPKVCAVASSSRRVWKGIRSPLSFEEGWMDRYPKKLLWWNSQSIPAIMILWLLQALSDFVTDMGQGPNSHRIRWTLRQSQWNRELAKQSQKAISQNQMVTKSYKHYTYTNGRFLAGL